MHQARAHAARAFYGAHMRQARHFQAHARRCGFDKADGHVAAQHLAKLGVGQRRNGVAPKGAGNHNRHGHGNAKNRQAGAQRAAFHGANHHAQRGRKPVLHAPALNQHGPVHAGRGRAHGFGRCQLHRGANGVKGGQHRRTCGHGSGGQHQPGLQPVAQRRKAKCIRIQAHKPLAQHRAQGQPDGYAQHHNHQHQLEVVQADGAVVVAQRLERGHLFALGGNLAVQHHVEQKPGHGQKYARQHRAHHPLLLDLGVEDHVRHLRVAPIGVDAAIGREQAVELVDHRAFAGARAQAHRHLVKGALHVVGRRQLLARHPKHAKTALVGRAAHAGKNVFRRQRNAHNGQLAPFAVDHSAKGVARLQATRQRKALGHQRLQGAAVLRLHHAAPAQMHLVQALRCLHVQPNQAPHNRVGHMGDRHRHHLGQRGLHMGRARDGL